LEIERFQRPHKKYSFLHFNQNFKSRTIWTCAGILSGAATQLLLENGNAAESRQLLVCIAAVIISGVPLCSVNPRQNYAKQNEN
jgi:hypothetical protein